MQSQGSGDGKERWIFAVTQQYTGSFNPTRRFGSRPRNRHQLRHIRIADRQLNHPPPCRHDLRPPCNESKARVQGNGIGVNPTQMTSFMESMNQGLLFSSGPAEVACGSVALQPPAVLKPLAHGEVDLAVAGGRSPCDNGTRSSRGGLRAARRRRELAPGSSKREWRRGIRSKRVEGALPGSRSAAFGS
jgi:hypothetical protein